MPFMVITAFIISHTNKEAKANTLMQKKKNFIWTLIFAWHVVADATHQIPYIHH